MSIQIFYNLNKFGNYVNNQKNMENTIIQFIIKELHNNAEDVEILPEDDLLGSGLVDSMGMMRVIQFLEETYDFKIPPQDMTIEYFMTVEAMTTYIKSRK